MQLQSRLDVLPSDKSHLTGFNFSFTAFIFNSLENMSEWKSKVESLLCDSDSGQRLCSDFAPGGGIRSFFMMAKIKNLENSFIKFKFFRQNEK